MGARQIINNILPWAVNTKNKGFCLAHHVDDAWLSDTTREQREVGSEGSRRPNRVNKCADTQDDMDGKYITTSSMSYTNSVYECSLP